MGANRMTMMVEETETITDQMICDVINAGNNTHKDINKHLDIAPSTLNKRLKKMSKYDMENPHRIKIFPLLGSMRMNLYYNQGDPEYHPAPYKPQVPEMQFIKDEILKLLSERPMAIFELKQSLDRFKIYRVLYNLLNDGDVIQKNGLYQLP
jgi:predicted transcriptional regulator